MGLKDAQHWRPSSRWIHPLGRKPGVKLMFCLVQSWPTVCATFLGDHSCLTPKSGTVVGEAVRPAGEALVHLPLGGPLCTQQWPHWPTHVRSVAGGMIWHLKSALTLGPEPPLKFHLSILAYETTFFQKGV